MELKRFNKKSETKDFSRKNVSDEEFLRLCGMDPKEWSVLV